MTKIMYISIISHTFINFFLLAIYIYVKNLLSIFVRYCSLALEKK